MKVVVSCEQQTDEITFKENQILIAYNKILFIKKTVQNDLYRMKLNVIRNNDVNLTNVGQSPSIL